MVRVPVGYCVLQTTVTVGRVFNMRYSASYRLLCPPTYVSRRGDVLYLYRKLPEVNLVSPCFVVPYNL